jgi:DNA-binding transcriptional LysR family regulator
VPSFPAALTLARASDLVALVPSSFITGELERQAGTSRDGLQSFPLPVRTEPITVSQMWHPRMDADPAHRWLRGLVRNSCR